MKELQDCRVLIVDDVKANVDVLVSALRDEYKLSVALEGARALEAAEKWTPDIVLLDVMMPGMDGYEVCRRLRARAETREVPVMFLSALDEIESKTKGFEAGGNDYLTKPFEILEVKVRVRSLLKARLYQEAVRARMERDLSIAREIQMGLLPRDVARFTRDTGLDIHALIDPAQQVGGDLYEMVRPSDDRLIVALGDVSGKGIPAAFFMTVAMTLLQSTARHLDDPDLILRRVNDDLAAENPRGMFVTLACAVFDLRLGRATLASAGHMPPILLRRGAPPSFVPVVNGMLAGIDPGIECPGLSLELVPGDTLVFYSDGVTEAFDVEENLFGDARLLEQLARDPGRTAAETVKSVVGAVQRHAGTAPQSDDICVLAVRYAPDEPRADGAFSRFLRAEPGQVSAACEALRSWCEDSGVEAHATADVVLAVEEVLSNVVRHGYPGEPGGTIVLGARLEDGWVRVSVRDRGAPFDPADAAAPDLDAPAHERKVGGLRLHLVRSVLDAVRYDRAGGENRVMLGKFVGAQEA